jgi:sugar phosphate permease
MIPPVGAARPVVTYPERIPPRRRTQVSTPSSRPTYVRQYVLAALLVITAINYVQRNCIGPAATTIEKSIGVTKVQLDAASGAFFLTYTLLQIPSGWLAQRFGPRFVLPFYAAGWSLALACCAAATGFEGLYAGRTLMGVFQAGIFPCATLILAVWYPAAWRGTATALLNSFMLLGGAAGGALVGYLLNPVGFPYLLTEPISWQALFVLYSLPGLLWAAWFVWWFRDRPEEHPSVNQAELQLLRENVTPKPAPAGGQEDRIAPANDATTPSPGLAPPPAGERPPDVRVNWLVLLSLPLILLCTQQCFRAAIPRLFDFRLPTYLEEERGLKLKDATALAAWPQYAGVVGGFLGGLLSDYVLRRTRSRYLARNGVAMAGLIICQVWYALAWFAADVYVACALLAVGTFFFTISSPCAYALVIDIGGKHLALAFGAMNMIGNLGSFAFVTYLSSIVKYGGWELLFAVWVGLHFVALACWLFLDPSKNIGEAS